MKIIIAIITTAAAIIGGNESHYSKYEKEGYTVNVTFDAGGGTFKGSNSTIIDLYNPSKASADGIKLLAPDDPKRDGNNGLTLTKAGYYLAGWYEERTPVDANDLSKGYTYSKKWDFETSRLEIDPDKTYSADESALTLYAAWVPYYNFEIYDENNELVAKTSAIYLTLPSWKDGDVSLNMDNFPKRNGYTLESVNYSENDVKVIETENKITITDKNHGEIAESLTPTVKTIKVYTTWQEGERYRIYSTDDLLKNATSNGYYEIYSDLDFTGIEWPSVFLTSKFSGKIFGNGHTISGISITSDSMNRIGFGLFSSLEKGAYIENLTFDNITHTIDLADVKKDSSFGLLAGSIGEGVSFKDVVLNGKIVFGDNCATLASNKKAVYNIGKVAGLGDYDGVTCNITVEKQNPGSNSFNFQIADDNTITLVSGNN